MRVILALWASLVAAKELKGRRVSTCASVAKRCLARCELEGAEYLTRHSDGYSHKQLGRCLDFCEENMCPGRVEPTSWAAPDATKPKLDPAETTYAPRPPARARRRPCPRRRRRRLSWRRLARDGPSPSYEVRRRTRGGAFEVLATVPTTCRGRGGPEEGLRLRRRDGRRARGRAVAPGARRRGRQSAGLRRARAERRRHERDGPAKIPVVSNALAADGDGEVEAVVWHQTGSDADGSKRYGISAVWLDGSGLVRAYDNDLGHPAQAATDKGWVNVESPKGVALKQAPGGETSLWSRPRAAGDVDGDGREEIWTVARNDRGACGYVLLKDESTKKHPKRHLAKVASVPSPYPLCDGADNSRHDAFVAALDGDASRVSLGVMGGRHEPWRRLRLRDGKLAPRWDAGGGTATERGGTAAMANGQTSHNVAVVDVDCDGRDEIRWRDGPRRRRVVDDIDPASPGAEVLLFSETGPEWGLYRAADGFPLVERAGPEFHLQWNLAVNVSGGPGLDVVGTFGGHFVTGGFAYDVARRKTKAYPFGAWPREAHNCGPASSAAAGSLAEINGDGDGVVLRAVSNAVDVVGDHREEVVVQMVDGSVRAYLNVDPLATPPEPTKLEDPHYRRFLAHGAYPSHVAALGVGTCDNLKPSPATTDRAYDARDSPDARADLDAGPPRAAAGAAGDARGAGAVLRPRAPARRAPGAAPAGHRRGRRRKPGPETPRRGDRAQPLVHTCGQGRFGFCFPEDSVIGGLIRDEDRRHNRTSGRGS
ncbi:glycosyl hydrolase [Aureococcus anophagefferens]|nr:glycosyl hydrolase [Aureococcus anophagefferens]